MWKFPGHIFDRYTRKTSCDAKLVRVVVIDSWSLCRTDCGTIIHRLHVLDWCQFRSARYVLQLAFLCFSREPLRHDFWSLHCYHKTSSVSVYNDNFNGTATDCPGVGSAHDDNADASMLEGSQMEFASCARCTQQHVWWSRAGQSNILRDSPGFIWNSPLYCHAFDFCSSIFRC